LDSMLETRSEEISPVEAIRLMSSIEEKAQPKITIQGFAEFLGVPQEQLVEKLNEVRNPKPRRIFVDAGGIKSAVIAGVAACVVVWGLVFATGKSSQQAPLYTGTTVAVPASATVSNWTVTEDNGDGKETVISSSSDQG
jgi:hypothetical protein